MEENNKKNIENLLKDTVEQYPTVLRKAIAKKFKDDGLVTSNKKDLKDASHFPIYSSNSEETIQNTLVDEEFYRYYENIEFEKSYKYSIPLFFELDNGNLEDQLNSLISQNTLSVFDENDTSSTSDSVGKKIDNCIPKCKKSGNYILIKFLTQQSTFKVEEETYIPIDIRFPVVISINSAIGVLEIRFDGGKFDADSQISFISPLVKYCMQWIKNNLQMNLFNVNADNIIECINNDPSKKAIINRQFMQMKSGASADLTASDNEGNTMPFIGEIRELIHNNEDIFNKCLESKKLLEDYLDELEETADYPYIRVKWPDSKKSHEFAVKINFNYYDGRYIQMHSMQSSARVMKERMEYAIEYLHASGAFTKGEEV